MESIWIQLVSDLASAFEGAFGVQAVMCTPVLICEVVAAQTRLFTLVYILAVNAIG